jgi:3'-phosphoadenosine 5'-phosphosulfate sulfotransferase (PAPS reductase)/FAD synthetase
MRQVTDTPAIADLIAKGAHFYVGHSGGKDSQAMYAALAARIPADQLHVVHADLGDIEWAGVKDHIRANIDHPLMIADAIFNDGSAKDFFGMVRQRRAKLDRDGKFDASPFPAPGLTRQCTSDLKTGPIWKVIKAHAKQVGAAITVNCVGIRSEESPRRAKKAKAGTLTRNKVQSCSTRQAYDWWPIAHWPIADVWAEIADAGQQPHPAYADGNERLSCMFCIMGSDNDLQHAYRVNPELAHRYIALEREVRSTMFYSGGRRVSLAEKLGIEIEINPNGEAA